MCAAGSDSAFETVSSNVLGAVSRLWINNLFDRTMRSRVRSTRTNRRFASEKKVRDDFFHGQLE